MKTLKLRLKMVKKTIREYEQEVKFLSKELRKTGIKKHHPSVVATALSEVLGNGFEDIIRQYSAQKVFARAERGDGSINNDFVSRYGYEL